MHHPDALVQRFTRRPHLYLLPEYADRALVRPVKTADYVCQGRLTGSILTQQRVDLSPAHIEVDPVVRDYTWKALGYTFQLNREPNVIHFVQDWWINHESDRFILL